MFATWKKWGLPAARHAAATFPRLALLFALWACCEPPPVTAQLRIVTYNTTKDGPHPGLATVLQSIGEQARNGIAKPIDVLLLQEQNGPFGDTQEIVQILNGIFGAGTYARGSAIGGTTDPDDRQAIVYKTSTVTLLGESAFGNVGTGTNLQPRQTMRYHLRPVGYDSTADFYVYNSHTRADDGSEFEAQRLVEAKAIRANYNTLPAGSHAIYAGDFNFYRSIDDGFQWLTMPGSGQAFDPIDRVGSWHDSPSFADVHTQSPCAASVAVCLGAIGGMDDRFDFQLLTDQFLDGEGLRYLPGSYHAFGNNGTTFNQNINQRSSGQLVNTYEFDGVTSFTRSQILDALWTASDHLPVVADYQLPAVMEAIALAPPQQVIVGQELTLPVFVSNAADVVTPLGADELDYTLTTSGDVSGAFLNQVDMALGEENTHLLTIDTSTLGSKFGMITVWSESQGVQNPLINIPISYHVVPLRGDYNSNGAVDAADYVAWRDTVGEHVPVLAGADGNGDGTIDDEDYAVWRAHFGQSPDSAGAVAGLPGSVVPEPNARLLVALGGCLAYLAGGTLSGWTRRS
jgi:endonuclease/exonuclease/phosphatase family metal-dependent hydrolase